MLNVKLTEEGVEIYLSGSDTNLANCPIDYVHQLQNVYYAILVLNFIRVADNAFAALRCRLNKLNNKN